jgi:hypothetical protein
MTTAMVKKMLQLLIIVILLRPAPTHPQEHPKHIIKQSTQYSISPANLQKHVAFLGSDSLEGRGTGTRGGELAARYLADELAKLRLIPIGDDSSYFQNIPMHGSRPLPNSMFTVVAAGKEHHFELGKDYVLYNSGAQTFVPRPAPLVFVGYGIIAPEFDYNDYQALDVEGKIVVFLSGEPPSSDVNYFDGSRPTAYSFPEVKQRIAISRGARGSIMIPNPREEAGRDWRYWRQQFAFEDVTLLYNVTANLSILMTPAAAQKLFEEAPISLERVYEMDATNNIRSFSLKTSASFRGHFQQRDFVAANVIGILDGADPRLKDSYLIVSAHYDHLGIGPAVQGDSIYNGVFDNAIGVAAVLEMARIMSQGSAPRRSVIFLFLTGEEKGLLGATYYVDHPVAPLHQTIANINVDGVALFDTFNDVVGVGGEFSTLSDGLQQIAGALQIRVSTIPPVFAGSAAFTRSDQIVFARAGIPAILLMEGSDYRHTSRPAGVKRMIEWGERVYHSPFDDLQQPMNFAAAQQHVGILLALCRSLANNIIAPEWKSGAPFINARLRSIAEKR